MARIGTIAVENSPELDTAVTNSLFLSIIADPQDLTRQIAAQNTPKKVAARSLRLIAATVNRIAAEAGLEATW